MSHTDLWGWDGRGYVLEPGEGRPLELRPSVKQWQHVVISQEGAKEGIWEVPSPSLFPFSLPGAREYRAHLCGPSK